MEDFRTAHAPEQTSSHNALLSEWMSEQPQRPAMELAAAVSRSDRQDGPGKDVADRLDRELLAFANQKMDDPSQNMLDFQQAVKKFEEAPNKKTAISEFGHDASRIKVKMINAAEDTYNKMQQEAAKDPERKSLEHDLDTKVSKFFDKAEALPEKESERVLQLLDLKPGETLEQRDERAREGLKNNPTLLKLFNSMEEARNKIEDRKTPSEKQLDKEHKRDVDEFHILQPIITKAAIRAEINA